MCRVIGFLERTVAILIGSTEDSGANLAIRISSVVDALFSRQFPVAISIKHPKYPPILGTLCLCHPRFELCPERGQHLIWSLLRVGYKLSFRRRFTTVSGLETSTSRSSFTVRNQAVADFGGASAEMFGPSNFAGLVIQFRFLASPDSWSSV